MVVVVRYISPNAEHIESLVHCGTGDDQQNVFQLEYLAEGNANTVYRLKPLDGHELPCELQGKLLRLRKDKPFIQSTKDQHAAFKCNFLHLFHKDNVVQHSLISINRDMLLALNTELDSLQASATRPKLRHSDKLAHDEEYGTLMTDMTARSTEILVELKPKWLLQSPDAPPGATRCRNCALRAQRMAHKANGGITPKLSVFCPLSLMDDDPRVRFRAAQAVVRSQLGEYTEHTIQHVADIVASSCLHLLETLRLHQSKLDPSGILGLSPECIPHDFLMAMTLRDCTLLIRANDEVHDGAKYEARLADLDLKHANPAKIAKWIDTEIRLIEEGWYFQPETDSAEDSLCYLSRNSAR